MDPQACGSDPATSAKSDGASRAFHLELVVKLGDDGNRDVRASFCKWELRSAHVVRESGLGVALLPAVKCRQDLESGRLVQVLPEWSGIDGILHLVFTSRRGLLPGVRATVEFLAQALRIAVD